MNTPRLITDSNGNAVWTWGQDEPFGDTIPNQSPNGTGKQFVFNQRFAGQYFDNETGLLYSYFRDFDPTTGRYVESDPIGLHGGQASTHAYVGGNPLVGTDRLGLVTLNWLSWANNGVLSDWADSYNPTNFNTVVIHGSGAGMFSPNTIGGPFIDGATLADALRSSPGYDPNKPTLLIACDSASSNNPMKQSGAQDFANELANPDPKLPGLPDNNTVYAPTQVTSPYLIQTLPQGANGQPGGFVPVNSNTSGIPFDFGVRDASHW